MRYIRFLKPPRLVPDKGPKRTVSCLITLTSDLGDSFFPLSIELCASLLALDIAHEGTPDEVVTEKQTLVWRTVHWTPGLRSLAITLPIPKSALSTPLRVRISTEPHTTSDTFPALSAPDAHGVVSAWSAHFNTPLWPSNAEKVIQRRFNIGGRVVSIWEETGESIARHIWDAGLAFSSHLPTLLSPSPLSTALPLLSAHALNPTRTLRVLELGTGCGIVGITLGMLFPATKVFITDLPEAGDIARRNIGANTRLKVDSEEEEEEEDRNEALEKREIKFEEYNWDAHSVPPALSTGQGIDVVLAADCTYNADSSPALVHTLTALTRHTGAGREMAIAIAMKMRHESEEVFFQLMADAGFDETAKIAWALPGDEGEGESVWLHVYHPGPEFKYTLNPDEGKKP